MLPTLNRKGAAELFALRGTPVDTTLSILNQKLKALLRIVDVHERSYMVEVFNPIGCTAYIMAERTMTMRITPSGGLDASCLFSVDPVVAVGRSFHYYHDGRRQGCIENVKSIELIHIYGAKAA